MLLYHFVMSEWAAFGWGVATAIAFVAFSAGIVWTRIRGLERRMQEQERRHEERNRNVTRILRAMISKLRLPQSYEYGEDE